MQKGQKSAFAHYEEDVTGCQSKKKLNLNFQLSLSLLFPAKKKHARRCFRTNCSHASPGVKSALKWYFPGSVGPCGFQLARKRRRRSALCLAGKNKGKIEDNFDFNYLLVFDILSRALYTCK